MKLEIGCGVRHHKGYKTIDIEPYANPDYLGDFRTMTFENIDEIRSHHLLEHFDRFEAWDVLKLWASWLKKGGVLLIETPDLEGICEEFLKRKHPRNRYWLSRHLYGSQEKEWAFHKDAWWEDKFKAILPKCGFKVTDINKSASRVYLSNLTVRAIKL
jgi:predicted SAM-dependent methyltransferase